MFSNPNKCVKQNVVRFVKTIVLQDDDILSAVLILPATAALPLGRGICSCIVNPLADVTFPHHFPDSYGLLNISLNN